MAILRTCRMCGAELHENASECPKCGDSPPNGTATGDVAMPLPHSGPGIASVGFAVFGWVMTVTGLGLTFAAFGPQSPELELTRRLSEMALLVAAGSLLTGTILGVVGVLHHDRNRSFAIVGVALSLFPLINCVGMILSNSIRAVIQR